MSSQYHFKNKNIYSANPLGGNTTQGYCCFPDGTKEETTYYDCLNASGLFFINDTECPQQSSLGCCCSCVYSSEQVWDFRESGANTYIWNDESSIAGATTGAYYGTKVKLVVDSDGNVSSIFSARDSDDGCSNESDYIKATKPTKVMVSDYNSDLKTWSAPTAIDSASSHDASNFCNRSFGADLDVFGDTLAIGFPKSYKINGCNGGVCSDDGKVFIYEKDGSWSITQTITSPETSLKCSDNLCGGFGQNVRMFSDTKLIIGSKYTGYNKPLKDVYNEPVGSFYLYEKDSNNNWQHSTTFSSENNKMLSNSAFWFYDDTFIMAESGTINFYKKVYDDWIIDSYIDIRNYNINSDILELHVNETTHTMVCLLKSRIRIKNNTIIGLVFQRDGMKWNLKSKLYTPANYTEIAQQEFNVDSGYSVSFIHDYIFISDIEQSVYVYKTQTNWEDTMFPVQEIVGDSLGSIGNKTHYAGTISSSQGGSDVKDDTNYLLIGQPILKDTSLLTNGKLYLFSPGDLIGSCCTPSSGCVSATKYQCESLEGIWLGQNTSCDNKPCSPKGACCSFNKCISDITEEECLNYYQGEYLGNYSICTDTPCGSSFNGACCVDGVCSLKTSSECATLRGSFLGVGTNCSGDGVCDLLGACCENNTCSDRIKSEDCDGTWYSEILCSDLSVCETERISADGLKMVTECECERNDGIWIDGDCSSVEDPDISCSKETPQGETIDIREKYACCYMSDLGAELCEDVCTITECYQRESSVFPGVDYYGTIGKKCDEIICELGQGCVGACCGLFDGSDVWDCVQLTMGQCMSWMLDGVHDPDTVCWHGCDTPCADGGQAACPGMDGEGGCYGACCLELEQNLGLISLSLDKSLSIGSNADDIIRWSEKLINKMIQVIDPDRGIYFSVDLWSGVINDKYEPVLHAWWNLLPPWINDEYLPLWYNTDYLNPIQLHHSYDIDDAYHTGGTKSIAIFFSDGAPNSDDYIQWMDDNDPQTTYITIGFGVEEGSVAEVRLKELANRTGGSYHAALNIEQLDSIIDSILADGGMLNCMLMSQTECEDVHGGVFNKNQLCESSPSPCNTTGFYGNETGNEKAACCYSSDSNVKCINTTERDCYSRSTDANWHGHDPNNRILCEGINCGAGACCNYNCKMGNCCNNISEKFQCESGWMGYGTSCQSSNCGSGSRAEIVGACCNKINGDCIMTVSSNCEERYQMFWSGRSCDAVSCPVSTIVSNDGLKLNKTKSRDLSGLPASVVPDIMNEILISSCCFLNSESTAYSCSDSVEREWCEERGGIWSIPEDSLPIMCSEAPCPLPPEKPSSSSAVNFNNSSKFENASTFSSMSPGDYYQNGIYVGIFETGGINNSEVFGNIQSGTASNYRARGSFNESSNNKWALVLYPSDLQVDEKQLITASGSNKTSPYNGHYNIYGDGVDFYGLGSKLTNHIRKSFLYGYDDWYIMSQDELAFVARITKDTNVELNMDGVYITSTVMDTKIDNTNYIFSQQFGKTNEFGFVSLVSSKALSNDKSSFNIKLARRIHIQ
jgi:hypothetical protein